MRLYLVACIFLLFTSLARAEEDAETIEVEGEETDTKDEGVCLSKENCAASPAEDGEAGSEKSGDKYTQEKQDGEDKEEEQKPKKGEEERHLVRVEVLQEGKFCDRVMASNDDAVTVHLRGKKASDGSEFITTYKEDGSEGVSVAFRMGVGDSIKGLELGIIGMCIAEKRRFTVPASLVRNGRDGFEGDLIPRGEDLIFEVELLGAVPNYQKGMGNMFKVMDLNKDGVIQREEMYDSIVGDESLIPRGCELADELTDEQMTKQDYDKDGVIQWKEFHLPKWDDM
ncbi:peptidyl-prolyl cis-trans isomerase FKBP7-like [Asterias amurensis]|uniref:peptidyl-prolyl cis-trans isomerase FKBP7-like n=1 Tax=Asterias amurensis TaxID=7602 RepID=UPI003AB6A9F8